MTHDIASKGIDFWYILSAKTNNVFLTVWSCMITVRACSSWQLVCGSGDHGEQPISAHVSWEIMMTHNMWPLVTDQDSARKPISDVLVVRREVFSDSCKLTDWLIWSLHRLRGLLPCLWEVVEEREEGRLGYIVAITCFRLWNVLGYPLARHCQDQYRVAMQGDIRH